MPVSVFENYELQTVSHEYMTQGTYIILRVTYPLDILTHCGGVTQIYVFNTVKLSTSASSP